MLYIIGSLRRQMYSAWCQALGLEKLHTLGQLCCVADKNPKPGEVKLLLTRVAGSWWLGETAFKLWCWKLLKVPRTARRSNLSILKEISPEYSLEELMLKLKLQYLGHLMQKANSFWKRPWCWERLKAGGEGDNRGWDGWMASPSWWTWV